MSTNLAPDTSEEPRDELRAKIEASERRMAERTMADTAQEAAGAATEYVKKNPLTVLGGAIAVGLVLGALSKPGRRAASGAAGSAASAVGGAASSAAQGVGNAAKKRGGAFASLLADALIAYGIKMIDEAIDGGADGDGKSSRPTQRARKLLGEVASARRKSN